MDERMDLSFGDNTDLINSSTSFSERKRLSRTRKSSNKTDLIDISTVMSRRRARSFFSNKVDLIDQSMKKPERKGSSFSKKTDLIDTSVMRPNPLDCINHLSDGVRVIVVSLLNLRYVDTNEKYEVLQKLFKIPGVSSVSLDDSESIIVTGTVNALTVRKELKNYRPVLVISKPMRSDESDEEGGSEQLDGELSMEELYSDEMRSLLCKSEKSGDSNSLTSSGEVLVGYLSATCEPHGTKPMGNPFRSLAVKTDLKSASEMTGVTECILVFSCNDTLDVDETSFTEAISKELHKREVTPLKYNLSGRERLDSEMLYRSSVGIMVLSNSFAGLGSHSLDHLVEIMEHWKAKHLVIIPVYFKVSLSDIYQLEDRFEKVYLQHLNSALPDRVQKWKAAMAGIASIVGHEWTKETQAMLTEEVVRNACLRLHLNNSKNLDRILALLNHSQPLDAEIVGIWGMAGIGKTTVAREIFGILTPQYDMCYFLQDFYLISQMKGLRQMRDDFYSQLFGENKLSIGVCDVKPSFMRDLFQKKTILVVLDDVSNGSDAEYVVGGFGWFSHGHRIILTSRKKQVLVQCKVKKPYEIQKLNEFESFRFCKQYFKIESANNILYAAVVVFHWLSKFWVPLYRTSL